MGGEEPKSVNYLEWKTVLCWLFLTWRRRKKILVEEFSSLFRLQEVLQFLLGGDGFLDPPNDCHRERHRELSSAELFMSQGAELIGQNLDKSAYVVYIYISKLRQKKNQPYDST